MAKKPKTKIILDHTRVGKKGFPIHWEEMGKEPPLIEVPEDDPRPVYVKDDSPKKHLKPRDPRIPRDPRNSRNPRDPR